MAEKEEFVTVRVTQGALKGRRVTAKAGNTYFSFQGIPYAKPPVGSLRYKIAQPADSWNGLRDALKEGPPCPQIEFIMKRPYRGDEDCLYLNVYSPKVPSTNQTVKYPVMVWIHGGGFEVGSGDSDMYGPEYLVGEDVVVVTINYRLGIFGFMNVGDIPYNLGLKDQVAALRWIKENIAVFGGDPKNVTIFGESAGGASVHHHIISPMSKGLFQKAILESGCILNTWTAADCQNLSFELAKALGSNAASTSELVDFLRSVPARDLIEKYTEIDRRQPGGVQIKSFRPTPEADVNIETEVFVPAHPLEMEKNQFQSVPCIIGMNSNEGIIFVALKNILKNPASLNELNKHFENLVPADMISNSNKKEIAQKIKQFYFGNEDINESSIAAYCELIGDIIVTTNVDRTTKMLAKSQSPVYYYNFDFVGKLNFYKNFVNANDLPGASHLDELGYLFATPFFNVPEVKPDSREGVTRRRMLKLWTNFAKTGNPTPELDPAIGVTWPRYTSQKAEYLNISDTLSVQRDLNKEKFEFWNNL